MSKITPKESEELLTIVNNLKLKEILETLEELGKRELELLDSAIGQDKELREITLWNVAILSAAAEMLSKVE